MASSIIYEARSNVNDQPPIRRFNEKATQTFLLGVPVEMDQTVGGVIEWDGTTLAAAILGFSKEPASNLTTTGVPKTLSYGSVPFQPSAVNIPEGAPINDGRIGVVMSAPALTVFHGQVGPAQTTAVTDVTKSYGMTKDSDGHWYVDKTKTGANAVVEIVGLDQFDITRGVFFTVLAAAAQSLG